MDSEAQLPRISTKHFAQPIKPDITAYCGQHDLLAVVPSSTPGDVAVFRINTQPVFVIKRANSDDVAVTALEWKADGEALAVGWSDGVYGIYDGQGGRVVGMGSVRDTPATQGWKLDLDPVFEVDADDEEVGGEAIALFGWASHDLRKKKIAANDPGESEVLTTEDWAGGIDEEEYEPGPGKSHYADLSSLTTALTLLDVTKILPRLSNIPSHGIRPPGNGSKFVSQAATDGIFDTQKDSSSEKIEILLVCGSHGTVRVLMDDSVKIGSCHVDANPFMHNVDHHTGKQILLARDSPDTLSATSLDLPFDVLGGSLHHLVATNTKRIQNLLSYITHTVRCIDHDLTTGFQFPSRLTANMNEELAEKQEGDVVSNLYHLAMTGDFTPVMLEWLVDIVKETNHKRWDQAVNTMYLHIQNHVFINLLPALDRLSIATTTIRGHTRYHEGTTRFEVPTDSFTKILDGIDSLRLVAQKLQLLVTTEHKQFRAFSKWLRIMVDIGVAGPGSKGAAETEEREIPNLDYPLLLAYIKDTLMQSRLIKHTAPRAEMRGSCTWAEYASHPTMVQMSYERTLEALRRLDAPPSPTKLEPNNIPDVDALLNLPTLAVYLAGHVKIAIDHITAWQSRILTPPAAHPLPDNIASAAKILDMSTTSSTTTLTFTSPHQPDTLHQSTLTHDPRQSQPATPSLLTCTAEPGARILATRPSNTDGKVLLFVSTDATAHHVELHDVAQPEGARRRRRRLVLHRFGPDFVPDVQRNPFHLGPRPVAIIFGNGGREWRAFDLKGIDREDE